MVLIGILVLADVPMMLAFLLTLVNQRSRDPFWLGQGGVSWSQGRVCEEEACAIDMCAMCRCLSVKKVCPA